MLNNFTNEKLSFHIKKDDGTYNHFGQIKKDKPYVYISLIDMLSLGLMSIPPLFDSNSFFILGGLLLMIADAAYYIDLSIDIFSMHT